MRQNSDGGYRFPLGPVFLGAKSQGAKFVGENLCKKSF